MDPASWARHRGDFRRLYCRGQRRSGDLRRLLRRVHIGVRRRDDHRQRVPELPAGWGSGVGESRARREGWRGGPGRVGRRDEAERRPGCGREARNGRAGCRIESSPNGEDAAC